MQGPLLLVVLFAFCNVAGAEDAASCEGDDPALLQSKQTRSLGNLSLQNVQLHSLPIPPTTCAHCCWQDGEEVPCLDVEGCAARGPQKGKYAIVLSLVGAAVQSANETRFRYFASMRAAAKLAGADILLLVDKRNSATLSPFVLKLVQDKELKLLLVDWEVPPQMTWTNSKVPWCGRQDFIRLHVLGLQGYDAAAYYDTDVEFRGDITPMLKCAATGKFLSSSGGIGEPLNVGFFALRPDNRLLSAALALAEIGFDKQTCWANMGWAPRDYAYVGGECGQGFMYTLFYRSGGMVDKVLSSVGVVVDSAQLDRCMWNYQTHNDCVKPFDCSRIRVHHKPAHLTEFQECQKMEFHKLLSVKNEIA